MFFIRYAIISVFLITSCFSIFALQTEAELQAELLRLEAEIKGLSKNIDEARKQGVGLKTDLSILEKKIGESKLKIRQTQATISSLSYTISEKDSNIKQLDAKIDREKDSLAQILRKKKYLDSHTLVDFSLQDKSLSSFFADRDAYGSLERALNESFGEIRETRNQIENAREELEDAKDEELEKKIKQEAEKNKVESNQKEKNKLLQITKGQEQQYQKVLVVRQAEVAQIRARLFALRDSGSISFGQAYDYALAASKSTGVRPALTLAILMQESSLGKNLGSCFLADTSTGSGVSKSGVSKPRSMNPTRDIPPFLEIVKDLGRDPLKTQVSCWIPMYDKGVPYGWGGAMGPSQFIPSTWKLLAGKIRNATGAATADPWNAYHAITATAVYLSDLGARTGDESSERNAACKYYSGKGCARSSDGAGYGNSVMRKVYSLQGDIDRLQ